MVQKGLIRMSSFNTYERKDLLVIGFVVKCDYWGTRFYVEPGNLFVSPTSIMIKNDYVEQGGEWYEDKMFYWGIPKNDSLIEKFDSKVVIEEVTEVPDWIGKTCDDTKKEIEAYRDEVWKRSWFYKLTHIFAKKEN